MKPPTLRRFFVVLLGILLGVVCVLPVWQLGGYFDNNGHQVPRQTQEFAASQGSAWFYLAVLVLAGAAVSVLFIPRVVRSLNGDVRAVLLAFFFVMLGGMSLCNVFSASSLFLR